MVSVPVHVCSMKKDNGSVIRVGIRTNENSRTPKPKSRDLLVIIAKGFPPLITAKTYIPARNNTVPGSSFRKGSRKPEGRGVVG